MERQSPRGGMYIMNAGVRGCDRRKCHVWNPDEEKKRKKKSAEKHHEPDSTRDYRTIGHIARVGE